MSGVRDASTGPSWDDLGGIVRLLERTSGRTITISSQVRWDARKRREEWTWVVEAVKPLGAKTDPSTVRRWGTYPSVGVRTVPALLYRLVQELDYALLEAEREREVQSSF